MHDNYLVMNLNEERLIEIAAAWRKAVTHIAYIPMPSVEIRRRFERMTTSAIDALGGGDPADIEQVGRAIGQGLVDLNLLKADALQNTLSCLAVEFEGVTTPTRLMQLLAGISGGFVAASQPVLLKQQEAISRAATYALTRTQKALESSRDRLAQTNRELSFHIAERARAEETQREYARRLQGLREIDLAILSAESLSAIVDISIDYLHHIIPAHVISIALIDSERDQLIVQRSTHAHYPTGRIFSLAMFDALRQLERGHVYINRDLSPSRDRSLNMTEIVDLGGRSLMAVPLRYHEVTIGCVIIVLSEVRDFSAREINGAREIADSITVAIQNRQLLEAEQEARQRESILREVAASLALDLTPGELSRRILTMLDTVISFRSAAILLLEDGVLRLAAQHGDPVGYEQSDKLLARRPRSMWAAIESMQPVIIEDTSQSPDWVAIAGFEYIRAWMGVPLLVKGECVGLLAIDRDQPNTFDEKDRDLAMAFANQAAIAIENGRLFVRQQAATDELGRRYREREREFNVLYGITVTAVSKTDLESLLERLLELVIEAFGGSMAAIFLDGGNERGLELAAITARQTLVTEALCELVSGNLDLWPPTIDTFNILSGADLPDGWPGADGGSLAVLPLRSSGSNLGLFCLAYDSPGGVPDETIPLLVTVVDQIAVAVENIRLRQIARQAAIIEERERLAREIHDSVTQSIYSIGLFAGAAQGAAQTGNLVKTQQSAQSILDMTDLALRELRSLLFELRTELLARLGLVGALRERLSVVEHRLDIQAEVRADECGDLPIPIEEAFYRIALEALNNSLRHSHARQVVVTLATEADGYFMSIVDDGVGFNEADVVEAGRMGLESMRKRTSKVGGTLTLETQIGRGTAIIVRVPR